ncbi:CACTA en-spm transposon protein [Cucumis melo var. makuwa]|uniref:CACTA en-spm transposon protein n=1 Tax=Cucumis melo var. makuwa TaxID=1194695 RepID=A0A5D3BH43_CUCMM|nr:CACTA en-spm transposon protein [Cucumis melo var. makuwa]TYJ98359.1 CACTA en-spm transposon protein [Cucumis melo var. makuwa]
MPTMEDIENEHLNVLEIVVGYRMNEHIEDDTLCIMVSFSCDFHEANMFLELDDTFINMGGSSFVGNTSDQAPTRFVEHQMLNTWKEFWGDNHRPFKKFSNPEEAHANPPLRLKQSRLLERSNLTTTIVGPSLSYNDNISSLNNEATQWTMWSCLKKHTPVGVAILFHKWPQICMRSSYSKCLDWDPKPKFQKSDASISSSSYEQEMHSKEVSEPRASLENAN